MKLKIRKATINDLDTVFPLKLESKEDERKLNKHHLPIKKVKKHYKYYLEIDLKGEWRAVFIAFVNKKIIGMVIGKIYRSLRVAGYKRRASVSNLYVKPEFRKKKVGKKLMGELIKWFKSKKVKGITLAIYPGNELAEKMYERMGFKSYCKMMYKKV